MYQVQASSEEAGSSGGLTGLVNNLLFGVHHLSLSHGLLLCVPVTVRLHASGVHDVTYNMEP